MNRHILFLFLIPEKRLTRIILLILFSSFLIGTMMTFPVSAASEKTFSTIVPQASKSLLLDGCMAGARAVAVGERGHILFSDDNGDTWKQANVPTIVTLTGVFFLNKDLGWAVGHDAVILKTTDGGENWTSLHHSPEEERPLFDVWFKDEKNGIAIGAYGFFLATHDGGVSWSAANVIEDEWHLNQIMQSPTEKLYIAAEAGTIYRSDDGGQTFFDLPSPYEGSFFGALPLDGDTLLLFGLRGNLYRSEDSGETWKSIATHAEAMLNNGCRLPDGRIVIVGMAGTILYSKDSGLTFSFHQQADRKGMSAVLPVGNHHVILIGESGVKKISTDEIFK